VSKRNENRLIKQNQKEKKERAFKIEPVFNTSVSEILMDNKEHVHMDIPKLLERRYKNKNEDKWCTFPKGYRMTQNTTRTWISYLMIWPIKES